MGMNNVEKLAVLRRLDSTIPDIYADVGRDGFKPNGMTGMPDKLLFLPSLTPLGDYHDWTYHFVKFPRLQCDERLLHLMLRMAEGLWFINRFRMRWWGYRVFSVVREVGRSYYDSAGIAQLGWSR